MDEVMIVDDVEDGGGVEVVDGVEAVGDVAVDLVEEVEDFVASDGVGKIAWEFFGIKEEGPNHTE